VIEDDSNRTVEVNGYANLTVNSSHISAGNCGITVSTTEYGECVECGPSFSDSSEKEILKSVLVNVEDTEILGGSYGVRCSGRAIDCSVTNSRLLMNLAEAVSCENVRSCTVQHCIINSSSPHQLAINAVNIQTLVAESNVIANKTGRVLRASMCNSVQARFFVIFNQVRVGLYPT